MILKFQTTSGFKYFDDVASIEKRKEMDETCEVYLDKSKIKYRLKKNNKWIKINPIDLCDWYSYNKILKKKNIEILKDKEHSHHTHLIIATMRDGKIKYITHRSWVYFLTNDGVELEKT